MLITNFKNLPEPVIIALNNDPYSAGDADISVTTLIDSPRVRALSKKHEGELTEDASMMVNSFLGSAVHYMLEMASDDLEELGYRVEERLDMVSKGWKVSGAIDLLKDGVVSDYKTCSVWKITFKDYSSWEKQLNVYAELQREIGREVTAIQAIMFIKDWSYSKVAFTEGYPEAQIMAVDLPLWDRETCQQYIRERVQMHQDAEKSLPLCTDEERWKDAPKYALMKKGRKSALRVCNSEDEVREWAVWKGLVPTADVGLPAGHTIELRPSVARRCKNYCPVFGQCSQAQNELGEQ